MDRAEDRLQAQIEKSHNALAASQSKFVGEIRKDLREIRASLIDVRKDIDVALRDIGKIEDYMSNQIAPNIQGWNETKQNQSKVAWIIITSVLTGVLALVLVA